MRDALSKKIVDIEPSGIRKFFDIVSEMPDAISLGVGEPDFDTPYRVREEGIYSLEKGRTFYTSNAGLKELRYEISRYIARKYNLNYSAEDEIMVTVGGSEAIDVALRCMVDPGDEVLIPQPCYVSYVPCAVMADAKPVAIELKAENEFKLTKEELIASITDKTKILILAYPNNPTGAIMTKEELAELAAEQQRQEEMMQSIISAGKLINRSTQSIKGTVGEVSEATNNVAQSMCDVSAGMENTVSSIQ